jgi:hypothetical protein
MAGQLVDCECKGSNSLINMQLTAKIPQLCRKNAEQPQKLTAIAPQNKR